MPVAASYYVAVHTGKDYDSATYDQFAGELLQVMTDLLGDHEKVAAIANATLTSATSEVEVCLEGDPRELVAKAVVDILTEEKPKFDKPKLTKFIKENALSLQWPRLKIMKRLVED